MDEVDASYAFDKSYAYHAVKNKCKGRMTGESFLTALHTDELDRKVRIGELKRLSLPRRFHGNPFDYS